MDSLTQIVLGAACGEVVLGKKIGNRAMLWGAVAGTIPDLDVLSNFVTDEMTALAFHRGISHSLFFAASAPFVLGWATHKLYKSGLYKKMAYKAGATLFWLMFIVLLINLAPIQAGNGLNLPLLGWSVGIASLLGLLFWRVYWRKEQGPVEASYRNWIALFFWAIFTHPLLDSCTTYGTQLFQPFLDYRVAFNTISVVDPVYTLPFLILLVLAMRQLRTKPLRRWLTWAGIVISTTYLAFTAINKVRVDKIFSDSLKAEQISHTRFTTSPTILNNILWQGVAEGDTAFYHGYYSFFDPAPRIDSFTVIPKRHELLKGLEDQRDVQIIQWFSNGYYNAIRHEGGTIQLNDLRYGSMDGTFDQKTDYIFRFELKEENGQVVARQSRERPGGENGSMKSFWERMRGLKK